MNQAGTGRPPAKNVPEDTCGQVPNLTCFISCCTENCGSRLLLSLSFFSLSFAMYCGKKGRPGSQALVKAECLQALSEGPHVNQGSSLEEYLLGWTTRPITRRNLVASSRYCVDVTNTCTHTVTQGQRYSINSRVMHGIA